ncbi:YggS family pyridoxal phosphate-dependent enzyme [Paenibacillus sp. GCM10023248]|uniref:YggS family pyridoxal phosphate-dependent enzyme n=1 Tax=Bacillales TaxID=1385 RepID=UPI002379446D|nr:MULTISPECIES: YggS family pyridoxal phosphate-dependent enzyme [Bacillales]MDD9270044.1 YggS family pyridoxal phosphate-dependent enzyme [Paenibacillus sp. MAHUQ-63]MDR6880178.1 pyridoxal phosphate enzyme (YggS family) [Bacillus sp. 3255]
MSLLTRMKEVESRVAAACQRAGRDTKEINIIAVTKYVSLETTRSVLDAGMRHIGENRWQDVKPKWEALHERGTWHFIGHLQTNKVKDVIGKFAYIHSLDRMSLAKELDKQAAALGIQVNCLLQVNVSGEESKYGIDPQQFFEFASEVSKLPHIQVTGLMTMAPYEMEAEATRPVFRGLRELRDRLNDQRIFPYEIKELSMGMSGDFEVAIEEGATWIRLGTVLVGKEE